MRRLNPFILSSVSFAALSLGVAVPAQAQTPAPAPATDQPDPECLNMPEGSARDRCISGETEIESGQAVSAADRDAIVVTGSRIRRPNLESPVPITSISQEELTMTGDVNVGDRLNDLPSLRSTFSQSNSTRFIGTAGINVLDLRGLGTSRTLVLVNGRRHITYTPGDYLVDVNTIPTDLIERVDVVTGGQSAVYGSDAIAGVVNFILKRNFDGVRLRGQAGISSRGDRGVNFISLTAGENFFDNRANVAVNLEYVDADPLYFRQRPNLTGAFSGRCQFNAAEPTAPPGQDPAEPRAGDDIPDQQFFCGVRNATIANGGVLSAATPSAFFRDISGPFGIPDGVINAFDLEAVPCNDPNVLNPAIINPVTANQRCRFPGDRTRGVLRFLTFSPSGSACEVIPGTDFRPFGSGNYIARPDDPCALGSTLRDTGQLAPGLKRYMGNILAHFDWDDAFKPFVEAKFVRVDALQEGQPSFFQATFPQFFGFGRGITCDNPFITDQMLATFQTIGRCPSGRTATALPIARFNVDFGGRQEKIRRDTYRVVGGITGDFNEDWNYEVSINYGRVKTRQDEHNDLHIFEVEDGQLVDAGPFLKAVDAVRDPNTGQIVCRVNSTSLAQNPAGAADDDPACVPINLLGEGNPSAAALSYVNRTSWVKSKAAELDLLAYMGGDTSQWFSLPGGPVRFVIGAEDRYESAHQRADPISAAGATFFNAFAVFDPPKLNVKEVFGELEFPILRDLPFAQELTVTGAARYSDYNTAANTTFAWNANAVWAPVRDIRFRGNYSKSVRVPTQSDLFSPPSQNFAFVQDPCDVGFINNGTPERIANCAAAGVPPGFNNFLARTQTTGFLSQGNEDLTEETGKSWTLGFVATPRWVPGLSISVDYYRITVENLISFLSAQQVLNACFDLPQPNQFCSFIFPRRADDPTTTDINEAFLFADPALISQGVNFAKLRADGIDMELAYRKTFANGHKLNVHGVATYVIRRDNYIDPSNPQFRDQQLYELGDPRWAANLNLGYDFGRVGLNWSMNYVGKQTIGTFEATHEVQGRPPTNPDLTEEEWYPDRLYHSARIDFRVPQGGKNKFNFYVGVDNIFDSKPPLGLLGTGVEPFDAIGRYFYGGATIDF